LAIGSITRVEPIEGTALTLREREGGVVEILAGAVVLLSSAALETERAFGRLCPPGARSVLVGGLGFGATARGVLDVVGPGAQVVVVEKTRSIEPIVRARYPHLSEHVLDDPRIELRFADVSDAISDTRDLDAILLDVDNGPHWAAHRSNARLYDASGLARAGEALASGGIFAVWSGYPADTFRARLRSAGFEPSVVSFEEKGRVSAHGYIGRKA
jgi:spermidine synthase